jgi:non-specific serine/threonine protein kinase
MFERLAERREAARLFDVLGFVLQVWWLRGERRAGLQMCQEALALDGDLMTEGRARTLKLAGLFSVTMGDSQAGIDYTLESLSVFRALDHAEQLSAVLINLGGMSMQVGRNEDAMRFLQEAIVQAERAGIPNRAAVARDNMVGLALLDGDYETAVTVGRDVVATLLTGGNDATLTMPLFNLAFACFRSGRYDEMVQAARECLNVAHRLGDMRVLADVLLLSAAWTARAGEAEAGARLLGAAEGVAERLGLGSIGGPAEAVLYEETSESLRSELGERYAAAAADGRRSSVDGAVRLALASLD